MVREYDIDPGSNSFLELMRNLGMGAGTGGLRDIAGSNQASNSPSPLNATPDDLNLDELWDIMADISHGVNDIRHLNDDPTRAES